MGPAVLFDTFSIFFRAYHALPPMTTSRGEPTSALYGFCSLLLKIVREREPLGMAFALDAPAKTFRHDRYQAYKGTRDAAPEPLVRQLARLDDLFACLDLPVYRAPGFEADDVLATLARRLREAGDAALVVSGDRDLLQLARGAVAVLFTGSRGQDAVVYDAVKVEERFGVPAAQLPSLQALLGDTSDNLPGIKGVGPRTAARLVREHGDVEGLLARLDAIMPEKLRLALGEHRAQLRLNEELSRLRDDVPLPAVDARGARDLAAPLGLAAIERLAELFRELEFRSLAARLATIEARLKSGGG